MPEPLGISDVDVFAVIGDPLNLTCQLSYDSSANCSTPFFVRPRNQPLGGRVQQLKLNESAIKLAIEHVSADDNGSYFCHTGPDDSTATTPTNAITVIVTRQFGCVMSSSS